MSFRLVYILSIIAILTALAVSINRHKVQIEYAKLSQDGALFYGELKNTLSSNNKLCNPYLGHKMNAGTCVAIPGIKWTLAESEFHDGGVEKYKRSKLYNRHIVSECCIIGISVYEGLEDRVYFNPYDNIRVISIYTKNAEPFRVLLDQ